MHPQLNLPSFDSRLRLSPTTRLEEIWDTQRRRWVRLPPEEWVRQHFVHFLIQHKGYPTKAHYAAIGELGPCDIHRRSFLKKVLP